MYKVTVFFLLVFLVAGCQGSGDELNGQNQNTIETEEGELEELDSESEALEYKKIEVDERYVLHSHLIDEDQAFYTAFSINRNESEEIDSLEKQVINSLTDSDPSEQDILSSFTSLSLESRELTVQFNEEGSQLSTTTAQTALFYDSLIGISDLYGIKEIVFINPDGGTDIIVAEREVNKPLVVEEEREATRGYYTVYDEALEETLFLAGQALEEQVVNEEGELLSFSDTVYKMGIIDEEGAFYASAVVKGIDIVNATLVNGRASVQYTMDEDIVTEADRVVFENAIQLAALDFQASKVELVNDTLEEHVIYSLIEE
ncbi:MULTISPECIES: hypothetical protein [Bacillaceae]|uniref:Sporulation and spore germination protein n=1 Tax=Alkalicoccobacillus plakortidis TaxID=444060 RepID=A0A9D5HZE4_9BACI|nr:MULTISPECIES: hypothetical protein [Bacillaceae]KQL55768.1 hypothetical protein AN965_16970 [Alkalicoccobacillus plakortidis]